MSQLSAVHLASATANDPQFRLPERPCIAEGIVMTWTPRGLMVEGTGTRRSLTGRSARQILPDLLPLLDGSRTLAELAELMRLDSEHVHAVLLLLYSCGMLQEGPHPELAQRDDQYALLSRLLDTTRVNASAAEAQTRLDTTLIAVVAPEPFAGTLAAHLRASGMTTGASKSVGAVDPTVGLAVVWVDQDNETDARSACAVLYQEGIPVLLVGSDPDGLSIGPFSDAGHGACPTCCLSSWQIGPPNGGREFGQTAAALTAIEVVALVSRVGTPISLHGRTITDLATGRSEMALAARRPGCPHCGDPSVALGDPSVAYRFEHLVAFPDRRFVNPRDHQHHFESANVALQYDTKDAGGRDTHELPAPSGIAPRSSQRRLRLWWRGREPVRPEIKETSGRLALADVATVLALGFGLKTQPVENERVLRWAPTGGNLGSPQAYLVVHDVDGIEPGVYAYLPVGHQLAVLSDTPPWPRTEGTSATVVMTGAIRRVAKKYRTFAYRVVHLDAGCALSHAALAARGLNLTIANHSAWDDDLLARVTRIDSEIETVTGMFDLRTAR